MAGGVSIGWFDPAAMLGDGVTVDYFCARLRKALKIRHAAWPLAVSSVRQGGRGTGVAYARIDGHIPVHIDGVGLDDSNGMIFQFVLWTSGRPALLAAPATDSNTPIIHGIPTPNDNPLFAFGAVELKAGMAVHFDITTHWHGITSLPIHDNADMERVEAPKAIIMQVAGYLPAFIEDAFEKASKIIAADRPFWEARGK